MMAGLFDVFMPKESGGGLLDPELEALRRRQAYGTALGNIGRNLQSLAFGAPPPPPERAPGLLNYARLQELQRRRQDEERTRQQYEGLLSGSPLAGTDPASGIKWDTARPGLEGVTPNQLGVLRGLPAPQGMGLLAEQAFAENEPGWTTLTDDQERGLGLDPAGVWQKNASGQIKAAMQPPSSGEAPAALQIANAYRAAAKKAGKEVTELEALEWARSRVGMTPQDLWVDAYTTNRRAFASDEEARATADSLVMELTGQNVRNVPPPPPEPAKGPGFLERIFGGGSEAKGATMDAPAAPQTEADYNALPSGAYYVDPDDGKLYRKP